MLDYLSLICCWGEVSPAGPGKGWERVGKGWERVRKGEKGWERVGKGGKG